MSKAVFVRGPGGRGVGIQFGAPVNPKGNVNYRNINGRMYVWSASQRRWNPVPVSAPSAGTRMAPAANPFQAIQSAFSNFFHLGGIQRQQVFQAYSEARLPQLPQAQVGQTNPNFAPPSGLDATTMGAGLTAALQTLLTTFAANGVPSEHVNDPTTASFQQVWNNDPTVSAAGGNALLNVDGGYGPNTAAAVAAINGGSAPAVNTNPAPAPGGGGGNVVVNPPSNNQSVTMPDWGPYVIGAAAIGGAGLVGAALIKKHGGKVKTHAARVHKQLLHHAARIHSRLKRETKVFG
jgi:hypothetical protein